MKPEIIDPAEIVDLQPVTWSSLGEISRPVLIYLISASDPKSYPGATLQQMSRGRLMNLAYREKTPNEYIYDRFKTTPGIFNRLHLSLWGDAFPVDGKDYCLKMRFAAAFLDPYHNIVVARVQNRRMIADRLCNGTSCIRDQITSRTDAVMGDCGHAYLWGIFRLLDADWTTKQVNSLYKYEAGFNLKSKDNPNVWYEPWIAKECTYTCLHCITMLSQMGQQRVIVFKDLDGKGPKWVGIDLDKAFYEEAIQAAKKQGLKVPSSAPEK